MIWEIIRYPVDLLDPVKKLKREGILDGIYRIYGMGRGPVVSGKATFGAAEGGLVKQQREGVQGMMLSGWFLMRKERLRARWALGKKRGD
jgi:hypothetical protein